VEHAEPLSKHVLVAVSQHPVPRQVLPAQQACVLLPHAVHWPLAQIWLPVHAPPAVTHIPLAPSQHPPDAHVLPAQHTLPEAPHATQLLPWQI